MADPSGTAYHWKAAASGSWLTPNNWVPFGTPNDEGGNDFSNSAIFATGSNAAYTVTGNVGYYGGKIIVSHDHVTFGNLSISGVGHWETFLINKGAHVTVAGSSYMQLDAEDAHNGFLDVENASLTVKDHSDIQSYNVAVGNGGSISIAGGGNLVGLGSLVVGRSGSLTIFSGSGVDSYESVDIAGTVTVNGGDLIPSESIDGSGRLIVRPSGVVILNHGGNFQVSDGLGAEVQGKVILAGNSFAGIGRVDPGGKVSGNGTVSLPSADQQPLSGDTNDGVIEANAGVLRLFGNVVGSGKLVIDEASTLVLPEADTSENVSFNGAHGTLVVQPGFKEMGFISGFSRGDSIELLAQNLTSISLKADGGDTLLTAFAGSSVADTFRFSGHLSPQVFLTHDGHGNSLISFFGDRPPNPLLYVTDRSSVMS